MLTQTDIDRYRGTDKHTQTQWSTGNDKIIRIENHGGARLNFTQKLTRKIMLQILECLQILHKKVPVQRKKNNSLGRSTKTSVYLYQFSTCKVLCGDTKCLKTHGMLYVLLAGKKHGTQGIHLFNSN